MIPTIAHECSQFLKLSGSLPLLRLLPREKDGFIKVKVRHKKKTKNSTNFANIQRKAVFLYSDVTDTPTSEAFYVFPIDGFSFIYSEMIRETSAEYQKTLQTLLGSSIDDFMEETLKLAYTNTDLARGMCKGCEIIIYGISHYYAIRRSLIPDYQEFLK